MFENEEIETVIPPQPVIHESEVYKNKAAGFWMRFWAFTIDSLIVAAIIGILINPIFLLMDWSLNESVWYAPIVIISGVIYYSYFVIFTKFFSQTLGKMILGLRVQKDNGEPLDWSTVIFRECIGRFISNTFFKVPYLLVIFTPQHKGVHDFVADTSVIHEHAYLKEKRINEPNMEATTITSSTI
ncbi:RDD family protein [Lysinibacillus sp. 54212]|uniref:RDD family protein n=1 Tax=Lysinibacillus sp. 54212 TaxID=3119829 RepID=UPI002FC7DDF0